MDTDKPTKTWVEQVEELYKEGASDEEVLPVLNMTREEFNSSYSTNEKFKRFIDTQRMNAKAWWYRQGRLHLLNKGFNTSLWAFNMKNRHGWAEKSESLEITEGKPESLSNDELKSKTDQLLKKFLKEEGKTEAEILTLIPGSKRGSN